MVNNVSLHSDIEIYVIDPFSLNKVAIIDVYESLQWQPAYSEIGSFQLDCPIEYFETLALDYLIVITADKYHAGVIQYKTKTVDDEGAESVTVKGSMLESMLNNRVLAGSYNYNNTEPTTIVNNLLNATIVNPTDPKRKISNFVVGDLVKSDKGTITYGVEYSKLGDEIVDILSNSDIGFRLYPDLANKNYIFETYKGVNRTYQANTETSITTLILENYITNGDFEPDLSGWNQINNLYSNYSQKYSVNVLDAGSGDYILQKEKLQDQYPVYEVDDDGNTVYDDEGNPVIDHYEFRYLPSGYLQQLVSVNTGHIYYVRFSISNPTKSVLGFGIKEIGNGCIIQAQKNDNFVVYSALYTPDESKTLDFVVGYGDLPDENQPAVQVDYALLLDLTEIFGMGEEPSLEECDSGVYYENGWKYDQKIVSFIPEPADLIVFSRDRETLLDLEYTIDNENETNFLYVQGSEQVVTIDRSKTGIARKESIVDVSSDLPQETDGVSIPTSTYLDMLKTRGETELRLLSTNEIVDGSLYMGGTKQYNQDFFLGDVVMCADSKLGFLTQQRITAVNQVWDSNGYSIEVTLGDDIPNFINTMKLVKKGAL